MLIILLPAELNGILKSGVQKKDEIIFKKKNIQIYHGKVRP